MPVCSWALSSVSLDTVCLLLYQYHTILISFILISGRTNPFLLFLFKNDLGFHGPVGFHTDSGISFLVCMKLSTMDLVQCHQCSITWLGRSLWKVVLYSGLSVGLCGQQAGPSTWAVTTSAMVMVSGGLYC